VVYTSTAEFEYYNLCARNNELDSKYELNQNYKEINIYVDNKATIYMSKNNIINQKSKHINIRYYYVKELIANKKIKLNYINQNLNSKMD